MKLRCVLLILAIGLPAIQFCSSSADAQWKLLNQPSQKPFRLLGQGWGAGYHWRNPGHDSSYYHPYSHHNSSLRSHWNSESMYSTGLSQSLPSPTTNIPAIEADFRPNTSNGNETEDSTNEPAEPAVLKNDSESRKPASGRNEKNEIEQELPLKFN